MGTCFWDMDILRAEKPLGLGHTPSPMVKSHSLACKGSGHGGNQEHMHSQGPRIREPLEAQLLRRTERPLEAGSGSLLSRSFSGKEYREGA